MLSHLKTHKFYRNVGENTENHKMEKYENIKQNPPSIDEYAICEISSPWLVALDENNLN